MKLSGDKKKKHKSLHTIPVSLSFTQYINLAKPETKTVRRPKNIFDTIQQFGADLEKTCFSFTKQIYNIRFTRNQSRFVMKSIDELKAQMEEIQ